MRDTKNIVMFLGSLSSFPTPKKVHRIEFVTFFEKYFLQCQICGKLEKTVFSPEIMFFNVFGVVRKTNLLVFNPRDTLGWTFIIPNINRPLDTYQLD